MDRKFYLDLAARGLRMPIGTDLVLRQKPDAEAILRDGARLGRVMEEAAHRFRTPLAIPVMDLTLEKASLLRMLSVPEAQLDTYHFSECPGNDIVEQVQRHLSDPHDPRLRANIDAIRYIARQTQLTPVGMSIGPFSLMSKLLADPITPLYMAGTGVTAQDDPEVRMVQRVLELGTQIILRSIRTQIEAGARLIVIAEPAANKAYLSPNQLDAGSDIFDRFVMAYNRQVRDLLDAHQVDLFFHCCGELTDYMVRKFNELDAVILSLGSSRKLWEDAALVSDATVLFGNLPTKRFYSEELVTVADVERMAGELLRNMRRVGHPFILGSECDVLSVPGCETKIMSKIEAMLACRGD